MMQTTFYIRLGSTSQQEVCWFSRGAKDSGPVVHCGELKEAVLRSQGERVAVLLPAVAMVPLKVTLPPLQGQKLRRAVPYAVEEQLVEEVEGYHFAVGRRQSDGALPLLAVNRGQMEQWQALFAEVELKPHSCLDEAQLLPWQPGELSLLLENKGALVRYSAHDAYHLPLEGLEPLLELALQGASDEVIALRIFDARGNDAEEPAWQGELGKLSQHYEAVSSPLSLLATTENAEAINLLQGEFSRREQLGRLWRPWRATAALLAAWLLLMAGGALYDYRQLVAEEERLYLAVKQVYRDTFPEAKNVPNPRKQMEDKLKELQGGGNGGAFVSLLSSAGPLLNSSKGAELQNLRYRQGELEVELQLPDLPALDALKTSLEQQGLAVEIRNASSRNNRVEGRLAIRGSGA